MRYRIALCGFSEFEYRAMQFSFQHPSSPDLPGYEVVDALADAEFAVVDADSKPAVKGVVLADRLAHAVFVGASAPPGAGLHLPRPIDPTRILRLLDELRLRFPVPNPRRAAPDANQLPTPDDALPPIASPAEPDQNAAQPKAHPAMRTAPPARHSSPQAKTAARAAARRARLVTLGADGAQIEPLRDAMVLDSDDVAANVLCALLERFGFEAHWVRTIPQASAQLAQRPFAAVFLDIALDSSDGLALLEQVRALPAHGGHPAPALLIVSAPMNPADRVRAALAGVGTPLTKPVTRGSVARALEASGVTLPADARRTDRDAH